MNENSRSMIVRFIPEFPTLSSDTITKAKKAKCEKSRKFLSQGICETSTKQTKGQYLRVKIQALDANCLKHRHQTPSVLLQLAAIQAE